MEGSAAKKYSGDNYSIRQKTDKKDRCLHVTDVLQSDWEVQ